jgi:hypothetical protein
MSTRTFEEPRRGRGDLGDGRLEGLGVPGRRAAEAADLADELAGGRLSSPVVAASSARRRVLMLRHMAAGYNETRPQQLTD